MDRQAQEDLSGRARPGRLTRRQALKYGLGALAAASAGGGLIWRLLRSPSAPAGTSAVFKGDAPSEGVWQLWQKRGWVKEAYHYLKLGANVQCRICPNRCLLAPGDRSRCRTKVNKDGTLYTLAFGNPCALHVDPIEKKPLFHFLPGTRSFSLATAGCVLRCLNCQNWDISQRTPEETKDARGEEFRLRPETPSLSYDQMNRLSLLPEDAVAMAQAMNCPSISYTYSEPIAYFEYAYDTCRLARQSNIRNVLVTCGSVEEQALRDWARYVDAAHVDLKGFDEPTYRKLNSGSLQPVLNTLTTLKDMGVWFEVVNLVVPTYTDKLEVIRRMCDWLAANVGVDCPLHFSRFMPMHKLTYLPPTPVDVLLEARQQAVAAGLRHVYVGNVRGVPGVENTCCPQCGKPVVERDIYTVTSIRLDAGRCGFCKARIAGVWSV